MPMTPAECRAFLDEHSARWPAERAAMEAARAEREARRDLGLDEHLWRTPDTATKAVAETKRADVKPEAKMSTTADWEAWVNGRIRESQRAADKAIVAACGDVISEERTARQKVEAEIAALQSQVSGLKLELAELRGELKAKSALAEMEARLMRLETPTRLKTVG